MKKQKKLLIYGRHRVGLGYLARSLALVTELSREFKVVFLSGGELPSKVPMPENVEFVQLPPVAMKSKSDVAERDVKRALDRRLERAMTVLHRLRPAVIVVDYFPFGKLQFSSELLPLLEAARDQKPRRPLTVCALQEIEKVDSRLQIYDDLASVLCNHLSDAVLFHCDGRYARLEETFHPTTPLSIPVHYTGFVVPTDMDTDGARKTLSVIETMLQRVEE